MRRSETVYRGDVFGLGAERLGVEGEGKHAEQVELPNRDRLACCLLDELPVHRPILRAKGNPYPPWRPLRGVVPFAHCMDVGAGVGLDGVEGEPLVASTVLDAGGA
jgi:hypothetical protein